MKTKTPILTLILLASCGSPRNTSTVTDDTMVTVSATECPSTNINGTWKLLYTIMDGKATAATLPITLFISNCSRSTVQTQTHKHTETFTLYRMKRYCADYQLTYPTDSIACITLHGDTLSMGECNNFGQMRWYYGRLKAHQ